MLLAVIRYHFLILIILSSSFVAAATDQVPYEKEFQEKVLKYGEMHHKNRIKYLDPKNITYKYDDIIPGSGRKLGDELLSSVYYDAGSGYYDMADYLSDSMTAFNKQQWYEYAKVANNIYKHWLETMNKQYNAQGFRNFSGGFYREYQKAENLTAKLKAKFAITGLRNHSAFYHLEPTSYVNSIYKHEVFSREVAYMMQVLLDYEKVGGLKNKSDALLNNKRINLAKAAILNHMHVWINQSYSNNPIGYENKNYKYTQAFMVGLSAHAMIDYLEWLKERRANLEKQNYHKDSFFTKGSTLQTYQEASAEIQPVLKKMAEWLWNNMWIDNVANSGYGAFRYVNVKGTVAGDDVNPAGDLNMIILPLYIYLYHITKDNAWLEKSDKIFIGGVKLAQWNLPKQYNQQIRSVKKYLDWR